MRSLRIVLPAFILSTALIQALPPTPREKPAISIPLIITNLKAHPLRIEQVAAAKKRIEAMPGYEKITVANQKDLNKTFAAAADLIKKFLETVDVITSGTFYGKAFKTPGDAWQAITALKVALQFQTAQVETLKDMLNENIVPCKFALWGKAARDATEVQDVKDVIINRLDKWLKTIKEYLAGNIQELTLILHDLDYKQRQQPQQIKKESTRPAAGV